MRGTLITLVVVILAAVALTAGCGALVSEDKAVRAAEDAGYTDVQVVAKDIWLIGLRGCGEDDLARFTVHGTNVRGEERELYVCASVFKGGTIRSK